MSRVATYCVEEKDSAKHCTVPCSPCSFLQLLLLHRLLWRLLWCFRLPQHELLFCCGRLAHPACMLAVGAEDSMPAKVLGITDDSRRLKWADIRESER